MTNEKENRAKRLGQWLTDSKVGNYLFSSLRRIHIVFFAFLIFTHGLYWATAWFSPWPYLIFTLTGIWFGQGILKPWALIISQATKPDYDTSILKMAVPIVVLNYVAVFACLYMFGTVTDGSGNPINGVWSHFYFSAVTLTTLGYGNLTPSGTYTEIIATIEAIVGFMGFAVLAGIVASIAVKHGADS